MAVSAVAVAGHGSTGLSRSWDLIATADGDLGPLVIPHGLTFATPATDGDQRCAASLTPLGSKYWSQQWSVASIDATNITLAKNGTGAGCGDAAAHVRLHFRYLGSPWD